MQDLSDLCDAVILGQEHSAGLSCDKPFQIFTRRNPGFCTEPACGVLSETWSCCASVRTCVATLTGFCASSNICPIKGGAL